MLKNLPLKVFSLILATLFWIFVVSLENTYFQFPSKVPVQVFNQAPDLALTGKLGSVTLALRADDSVILRALTPNDFEAYIDLRNIGAGKRMIPISVRSKNPQVNIAKIDPGEIEIELEPVREKNLTVTSEILGEPAPGFRIGNIQLQQNQVAASGADSVLKQIGSARAQIILQGSERQSVTKIAKVIVYDREGVLLEGVTLKVPEVDAVVSIAEVEGSKQVGVKARITGAVTNGVVTKIEVNPAVVSLVGQREALNSIFLIETEAIELKDVSATVEKKVKLVLPAGIQLASGQPSEVTVKVEIEKQ